MRTISPESNSYSNDITGRLLAQRAAAQRQINDIDMLLGTLTHISLTQRYEVDLFRNGQPVEMVIVRDIAEAMQDVGYPMVGPLVEMPPELKGKPPLGVMDGVLAGAVYVAAAKTSEDQHESS